MMYQAIARTETNQGNVDVLFFVYLNIMYNRYKLLSCSQRFITQVFLVNKNIACFAVWSAAEDLVSIINTVGHPIRVICDILGKSCGSEMFVMSATACHHNPAFGCAHLLSCV